MNRIQINSENYFYNMLHPENQKILTTLNANVGLIHIKILKSYMNNMTIIARYDFCKQMLANEFFLLNA